MQLFKKLSTSLSLLGIFIVPLSEPQGWEVFAYKQKPANIVSWSSEGMKIAVKSSASPVIYPFKDIKKVRKITVKGSLKGGLVFGKNQVQGESGADDFEVRIGLVLAGSKRLSWLEQKLAPGWMIKLQSLTSKETGIEKILFLNLSNQNLPWKQRIHPKSEYFVEKIVGKVTSKFNIEETFEEPKDVVAMWISVDGDDLKQNFDVQFSKLQLEVK